MALEGYHNEKAPFRESAIPPLFSRQLRLSCGILISQVEAPARSKEITNSTFDGNSSCYGRRLRSGISELSVNSSGPLLIKSHP